MKRLAMMLYAALALPLGCKAAYRNHGMEGIRVFEGGKAYIGADLKGADTYQKALEAVRRDSRSGTVFIGFSAEELEKAREVLEGYDRINPRVIDSLEPVVVKVGGYNATEEEKRELREILRQLESKESDTRKFEIAVRCADIMKRVYAFMGRAEPNMPDLDRAMQHKGRPVYEVGGEKSFDEAWKDFWSGAFDPAKWESGEMNIRRITDQIALKYAESWDVIYWIGNEGETPGKTLAHELGHLVHFENFREMGNLAKRFEALNGDEGNYLTDYAAMKGNVKWLEKNPAREWFRSDRLKLIENFQRRVEDTKMHIENLRSFIDSYHVMLSVSEASLRDIEKSNRPEEEKREAREEIAGDIEGIKGAMASLSQDIEKQGEKIKRYGSLIQELESLPEREDVKASLEATDEIFALHIGNQEDIAEAFAYAAMGRKPPHKAGEEKVSRILEFMRGLD